MSRRSSNARAIGLLFYLFILMYYYIIKAIIWVLMFFINLIIFYKSGYKQKSGNGFLKTYFNKGNLGEYKLYRALCKRFNKEKILANIYLPSQNIDNTEIDLLAIEDGRIYCFEMKNYNGYIFGSEYQEYWTQVIRYKTKSRFFNPIRQNYGHVRALVDYLGIEEDKILPIVVFSNNANLENVEHSSIIIEVRDIKKFFNKSNENEQDLESYDSDLELVEKLKLRTLMSQEIKDQHIDQVNELR